jgi:hypothetical protein
MVMLQEWDVLWDWGQRPLTRGSVDRQKNRQGNR